MLQSSQFELVKQESGYQLKGSLTYDSVGALIHQKLVVDRFNSNDITISCELLERIDSAGIALLIQWQRECEQHNKNLQLVNFPYQAISLLKANQLDGFFTTESDL